MPTDRQQHIVERFDPAAQANLGRVGSAGLPQIVEVERRRVCGRFARFVPRRDHAVCEQIRLDSDFANWADFYRTTFGEYPSETLANPSS